MYISARANPLLTHGFAPIDLAELNAKAGMLRRLDNKYVVDRPVMERAMNEFSEHFDVLEIGGKRAFLYETCYFDSADHACYVDHHRGRRQRAKVRIRNYADADMCFVEVKLKDKRGETVKRRMAYEPAKFGRLDAAARDHVQKCFRELYGKDFPYQLYRALDMRYQRITLVAKAGGERLTIDNNLLFYGVGAFRKVSDDVFIVETKSSNGNGLADKVLRSLHRHPVKHCSKYCAGTAMLKPAVKSNNFRQVLGKLSTAQVLTASVPARNGLAQ